MWAATVRTVRTWPRKLTSSARDMASARSSAIGPVHPTPALLSSTSRAHAPDTGVVEKHVVAVMPRQHVSDGGVDVGVGGDVELERLCGRRASEVGDHAEVMPSLKQLLLLSM